MEIIIADSSALILLARIGRLELTRALAARVVVPQAVWTEVTVARADAPGARTVADATWIEVRVVAAPAVQPLLSLVGQGEAEALVLAGSERDAVLLLDNARARKIADRLGLPRMGTLGLLAKAKQAGLIPAVRPLAVQLQAHGLWVEPRIVEAVLKAVDE